MFGPEDSGRIVASPLSDVDAFTDAVLVAEGLDPALEIHLRRQVKRLVAQHFAGDD